MMLPDCYRIYYSYLEYAICEKIELVGSSLFLSAALFRSRLKHLFLSLARSFANLPIIDIHGIVRRTLTFGRPRRAVNNLHLDHLRAEQSHFSRCRKASCSRPTTRCISTTRNSGDQNCVTIGFSPFGTNGEDIRLLCSRSPPKYLMRRTPV